jgi:hypothetical protein
MFQQDCYRLSFQERVQLLTSTPQLVLPSPVIDATDSNLLAIVAASPSTGQDNSEKVTNEAPSQMTTFTPDSKFHSPLSQPTLAVLFIETLKSKTKYNLQEKNTNHISF